jgi:hypothetical protein
MVELVHAVPYTSLYPAREYETFWSKCSEEKDDT